MVLTKSEPHPKANNFATISQKSNGSIVERLHYMSRKLVVILFTWMHKLRQTVSKNEEQVISKK